MKLSKIFHFLYFSVLSIPLVTIPIFAIYSQNHEINDNTLQLQENVEVEHFNQLENGIDYVETNTTYSTMTYDSTTNNIVVSVNTPTWVWGAGLRIKNFSFVNSHKYLITFQTNYTGKLANENTPTRYTYNDSGYERWLILTMTTGGTNGMIGFNSNTQTGSFNVQNLNLFDLTFMFGSGNEPTYDEFRNLFPNTFYEYTQDSVMYVKSVEVTYDDTDIMSQFMYQEYNFMDKYLGMYKYHPFQSIYQWLSNTFFDGNAPLVFTIFYQWFAYWLFVSLCWLVFDVLIYVPMVAHRWLDKGALE